MAKPPIHTIRFGLIQVSIWRNHTKFGDRHAVTASRSYKDGDLWRESARFGRDDLPVLAKALDMAHTWIYQNNHTTEASDGE